MCLLINKHHRFTLMDTIGVSLLLFLAGTVDNLWFIAYFIFTALQKPLEKCPYDSIYVVFYIQSQCRLVHRCSKVWPVNTAEFSTKLLSFLNYFFFQNLPLLTILLCFISKRCRRPQVH